MPSEPPRTSARGTPHGRIVGIDVARGIAVLGMFAAHLVLTPDLRWTDPSTWLGLVDGRSSILFATLAGLSIGIMTAGRPRRSTALLQARMRIVVRAGLILLLGIVLELFGTPIAVILGVYALLFVALLPFVTWSVRQLVALTLGSAVVGGAFFFVLLPWIAPATTDSGVSGAVIGGMYPAVLWFTFFAAGLTVSRLDLRSLRTQVSLLLGGAALVAAGHLGFVAAQNLAPESMTTGADLAAGMADVTPIDPADIPADTLCDTYPDGYVVCFPADGLDGAAETPGFSFTDAIGRMITDDPHTGSPFEVVGSGGFALGMIGLCLLACRVRILRGALWPVGAVGSMALTAYSVHIVVISLAGVQVGGTVTTWLAFAGGALLLCSLWKAFLGRGPLERLLAFAARKATDLTPTPDGPPTGGTLPVAEEQART